METEALHDAFYNLTDELSELIEQSVKQGQDSMTSYLSERLKQITTMWSMTMDDARRLQEQDAEGDK